LQDVRLLNNEIQIAVLTENDLKGAIHFAQELSAFSINPYYGLLTPENVIAIQDLGFEVHTWTVNEIDDIEKIKFLNVNAIISDFPDRI
jgi:glycerophosphoryl diester phosphodiesterase